MEYRFKHFNAGLTFIELIVVMSIFATLSGVVLFKFTNFTTNVSLQNLAHQIALQIRTAQSDAVSGKKLNLVSSSIPSYGVYFNKITSSKFIYFVDRNNDGTYDGSIPCNTAGTECLDEININTGDKISDLCVTTSSSTQCLSSLVITFTRPFHDAYINQDKSILNAEIKIESPKGNIKSIRISSIGQISIE